MIWKILFLYKDANQISETAFEHLAFILENEIDWPQLSYSTGHENNSWPVISGPTRSLYLHLFEQNRCNMRFFFILDEC